QPERRQMRDKRLGLGLLQRELVDDDQALRPCLGRKCKLEAERPNLLGKIVLMGAGNRPMSLAAAPELRGARRGMACPAGALLLVHLGARAPHVGARLGFVRSLLAAGKLPAHDALQDVGARLKAEDLLGEAELAGILARERSDLDIHYRAPST